MTVSILYIASLKPGGNGLDRARMLESAGFNLVLVDRYKYMMSGSRLEGSIASRFHLGRAVSEFNKDLLAIATNDEVDYDIIFVDKGVWIKPFTLKVLKQRSRLKRVIHFSADALFLENKSRHFRAALPLYDLALTTKSFEIQRYIDAGCASVKLVKQGYGPRIARVNTDDIPDSLRSEVVFIGHCQREYAVFLKEFAAEVPLKIWGPGWVKYSKHNKWARSVVQGDGVYGDDYARALSGAKIAIGLLSKRIPETVTIRSFEIPASGTMFLAERTRDHQELFLEGVEAEFFGTTRECIRKAKYYLSHEKERSILAERGWDRSLTSGYSYAECFHEVVDWIHATNEQTQDGKKRPSL